MGGDASTLAWPQCRAIRLRIDFGPPTFPSFPKASSLTSQPPGKISVLRILAVAMPLLVVGAFLAQFVEVYRQADSIAVGVPATGAIGLFVPLLLLCAAVPALRRRWSVTRGELVVVFSILALAIPIYGPGLWHHFAPLQMEFHRTRDLDRAMSISRNLWPNRGNLLEGVSSEDPSVPGVVWTFDHPDTTQVTQVPNGDERCVRIHHVRNDQVSQVILELDRLRAPAFPQALMRYAVWARVRLDDPGPSTSGALWAGVGPDRGYELTNVRFATKPAVLAPDRFKIVGRIDYQVPQQLEDRFYLKVKFSGRGTLWVRDVSIVDVEDVYRYLEGYEDASPKDFATLTEAEQGLARQRPDKLSTWERAKYILFGLAPWGTWAKPCLIWGLLIGGMFLGMFCLVTIFFRHWERGDRLTFPLQTFIFDLTAGDERGCLVILRSRAFWVGFGLCVLHLSLQQASRYVPDLPFVNTKMQIEELLPPGVLRDAIGATPYFPKLEVNIRPMFVAVAFFMSLEVSMSMVVFFIANCIYRFVFFFTPLKTLPPAGGYLDYGFPFQRRWAAGGLLFMAVYCVFSARKHLAQVAARVFLGRGADDTQEAVSYRMAVFGLLVTTIMFVAFAHFAEINPLFVVVYLGVFLLIGLSAARIRAETGLPHSTILIQYPPWILVGLGTTFVFGFRQIVFPAQVYFLYIGTFLLCAPIIAESMALSSRVGVPLRKLGQCLAVGFVVAVLVGGIVSMSWAYTVGALNMKLAMAEKRHFYNTMSFMIHGDDELIEKHFVDHPNVDPVLTDDVARELGGVQPVTLILVGLSFGITGLLVLARVIWLGFPLHPLGFALAFTPAMNALWSSIAVAYVVKSLALRFGGVQVVRQVLRPFFVGLFVAELLTLFIWSCIGATTQIVTSGG